MRQIEFHSVTKRFDSGVEALRGLNISFQEGSMTFLTGRSGAGKSTFLKLILRFTRATLGQLLVNGVNVSSLNNDSLANYRRHLGVVFQDHYLLADRTVFENIAIPLRLRAMRGRDVGRRTRAALSAVGLLSKESMLPMQLSTGEQQRVGIARAIVTRPKILLADEPTGNLDPELSMNIMDLFRQFNAIGTTVIIASHDNSLINSMSSRVVTLSKGQVISDESPF